MRRDTYDGPWKSVLERYFREFFDLFQPETAAAIARDVPFRFLDKELEAVAPRARRGRRIVDKLIEVPLASGDDAWVLIHVEVQGTVDPRLPERMFIYHYRLFDRFARRAAAIAVLTDDRRSWRPDRYEAALFGTEAVLRYPVIKLLDFEERREELERTANPFGPLVLAHLAAIRTRGRPEERLRWKWRLIRGLYEQGRSREDVIELLRFIDTVLWLPEELERQLQDTHARYQEEKKMPYLSPLERLARKDGRQEGRQEGLGEGRLVGLRDAIRKVLEARFGTAAESFSEKIFAIEDPEALHDLIRAAATVPSIEDLAL